MAKTTTNFGLIKPERSDNYSVDVMASNMDKIDAMVAPKSETDAMKEKLDNINFDSSNNIVANVTGKLNVSSVGTNENNIKVCSFSTSGKSSSGGSGSITLSPSEVTVTYYNVSILNCAFDDIAIKSQASATCSIVVTNGSNSSNNCTVTVKDSSGTQILSTTQSIGSNNSKTWTFDRVLGTTYTVSISPYYSKWSYSTTTSPCTLYVE